MYSGVLHTILVLITSGSIFQSKGEEVGTPLPTVSPKTEFIASPRNVTVLEGHPAVLRCKLKEQVHNCQWFYLELGLDIFGSRAKPILVMEFRPTSKTDNDCSIKFRKTRRNQAGQWVCKGLQIHARKYIVSHPAILNVIRTEDNSENGKDESSGVSKDDNDVSADITFHLTDDGYIINTNLGDTAILGCQANRELSSCSWIKPDGTTLRFETSKNPNYIHEGNYTEGNCSLRIKEVTVRDEGNWRCVVSTDGKGDKLGPLIHLHVLEFGLHTEGLKGEKTGKNDSSLIIILVVTSVVLLLIIITLVLYMYKNVWRRNSPPHKYLDSKSVASDYSAYGTTWIPELAGKDQKLIEDETEMYSNEDPNSSKRYLDMTGNKRTEGYVTFPASSVQSSMSSRTTISTFPAGHNAIVDSDNSARASASDSVHSVHSASTLGQLPSDKEFHKTRELPQRSDSVYSSGHLYEEIDETRMRRKDKEEGPDYTNIDEDQEGYVIPKTCPPGETVIMGESCKSSPNSGENISSTDKAPPYSKLGETGLVPDSDNNKHITTSNPTYSGEERTEESQDLQVTTQEPEESYDAPNNPPVPTRTDSKDNPLADYDVPRQSSNEADPVFV